MAETAKKILFKGRVQGVGFRFTAFNIANRYRLTGQVKNIPDGSVEMIAQGKADDIEYCIDEIKKTYPARIHDFEIENVTPDPDFTEFKITF